MEDHNSFEKRGFKDTPNERISGDTYMGDTKRTNICGGSNLVYRENTRLYSKERAYYEKGVLKHRGQPFKDGVYEPEFFPTEKNLWHKDTSWVLREKPPPH